MTRYFRTIFSSASIAAMAFVQPSAAESLHNHDATSIWFDNMNGVISAVLVVKAPNGRRSRIDSKNHAPVFKLTASGAADGVYRYELRALLRNDAAAGGLSNGSGNQAATASGDKPFIGTGSFFVENGQIVTPSAVAENEKEG